jgi:hypothetical protein
LYVSGVSFFYTCVRQVFGKFIPCLRDPNSKVNVGALQAMEVMTPALAGAMSSVVGHTVQTVVTNLASANGEIHGAAEKVLDAFMECIGEKTLMASFTFVPVYLFTSVFVFMCLSVCLPHVSQRLDITVVLRRHSD